MADTKTDSTKKLEDYFVLIKNNLYVKLNLPKKSVDPGLATAAGYVGELPAGAQLIGTNKIAALENGCVAFNVYYKGKSGKLQAARIIVSPSKADTFFTEARSQTYRDKKIENVRVPRRIKYVV